MRASYLLMKSKLIGYVQRKLVFPVWDVFLYAMNMNSVRLERTHSEFQEALVLDEFNYWANWCRRTRRLDDYLANKRGLCLDEVNKILDEIRYTY